MKVDLVRTNADLSDDVCCIHQVREKREKSLTYHFHPCALPVPKALVDASTQHTHTNGEEAASKSVTQVYSYEIATPTTPPYKMFLLSMC